MIIAARILKLTDRTDIGVRVFAPERADIDWICRFEIDWPEGHVQRWGAGVDAIQAMVHALQMIGAELYTSEYHRAGKLRWDADGTGFGFPVSAGIRDLLIGDDAKYL